MIERLLLLCAKYPLDFIAYLSSSLPLIFGVVRYKYLVLSSRLIVLFFLFIFLTETYATWLSVLRINNLYLQNIETIVETGILLAVAASCLQSRNWQKVTVILALICLVVNFITYQNNTVSAVGLSVFRIYAMILSLGYYNKILTDVRVKNILFHTMFWFCTGLLLYASGTFFIMLLSQYWYKDSTQVSAEIFDRYWNVSQVLFIIFSCISAYSIWLSKYDKENII